MALMRITKKSQLEGLALMLGMRADWHEPDEQDVTVEVKGSSFDNAGFWPEDEAADFSPSTLEYHVIIKHDDTPVATVNLATLFSWAAKKEY